MANEITRRRLFRSTLAGGVVTLGLPILDMTLNDGGSAMATFLVLQPLFLTRRRTASATSSNFSMLPSVIQPRSSGSMAQFSSTRSPALLWPSSTSLTPDVLTSSPSKGAG